MNKIKKEIKLIEICEKIVIKKLLEILDQEDCMGIRFYYGIGDDGKKNLIAVGATSDENDMVDGVIVEKVVPCPPRCPGKNPLNS